MTPKVERSRGKEVDFEEEATSEGVPAELPGGRKLGLRR